jgi:hypothetical protein
MTWKLREELLSDENRKHTAYKDITTPQRIAGARSEERRRVVFLVPDFVVVAGPPAEVPVTTVPPVTVPPVTVPPVTVPPTIVPAPLVFVVLVCDVVATSNALTDRAVTVHSCPIAV